MVRLGAVQINQNQVRQLSDIRYILADCSPLDAEIWIRPCIEVEFSMGGNIWRRIRLYYVTLYYIVCH